MSDENVIKLNLGCGDRRIDGYVGVDIALPADRIVDLSEPWPWITSTVSDVLAFDVAEHIRDCQHVRTICSVCRREDDVDNLRHPLGRIHFLNELHRVLIPGGHAIIEVPNAAAGVGMWQDPTHVSPWCLSTFKYFEHGSFAHHRLSSSYGITAAFRVISLTESRSSGEDPREEVWKIRAELAAVK